MADINVIAPDGTPGTVPEENAREALAQGYQLDTPELQAKRAEAEKYGSGALNPIEAFGAAALRAPTLGLSDPILEALGADREGLQKRAEYNPTADIAGTGAGLLAGGELAGASKLVGAIAAPLTAATKLGGVAGKGVSAIAKKLLGGVPGKIAEAIPGVAGTAADMAAQTAAYNAMQKIDETHLAGGDLQQGVENALASTGDALKLGAGMGVLMHGAGAGVRAVAGKAKQALGKLDSTLAEMSGNVDQFAAAQSEANLAAGEGITDPEDVKNLFKNVGTEEGAAERAAVGTDKFVTPEVRNELGNRLNAAATDTRDAMKAVRKQAFESIRPQEISEMLRDVPPPTEAAYALVDTMHQKIAEMTAAGAPKTLVGKLASVAERYETDALGATTAEETYNAIKTAKSDLGKKLGKWRNTTDPEQAEFVDRVLGVERALKDNLRNPELWGAGGAAQAAIDDAYSAYNAAEKFLFGYQVAGGGAKAGKLTTKVPNRAGKFDLKLNTAAMNTVLSQTGKDVARSSMMREALQTYRDTSRDLIDVVAKSAKTTAADFDAAGFKSLVDRFQGVSDEAASKLRTESIYRQAARADDIGYNVFPKVAERMLDAVKEVPLVGKLAGAGVESLGKVAETAKAAHGLAGMGAEVQPARSAEELMQMARTLSKLEGFSLRTSRKIDAGIDRFMRGAAKVKETATPILAYAAAKQVPYKKELAEKAHAYHDPAFASDLFGAALHRTDDGHDSPLAYHAPGFAAGLGSKQAEISQYLWNLYPKDRSGGLDNGKLSAYRPNAGELADYRQAEQVATDPLVVLEKMGKGLLTSRDVKIVADLWPKVLEQMQQRAFARATSGKEPPTRSQKQQLQVLMGQPVYDTQDPQLGQLVRASFQAQNQARQAAAQQAAKGVSRMADDSKTASQRRQK